MTTMVPVMMISVSNDSHREILLALNDALAKHETVQFGDRRFVPVYSCEDGWTYNEVRIDAPLPGAGVDYRQSKEEKARTFR